VAEHEDLELIGSITAAEHTINSSRRQTTMYRRDTSKGDLQQTGPPTLPPPRQPSHFTRSGFATHASLLSEPG
jgi:hypothetical protein